MLDGVVEIRLMLNCEKLILGNGFPEDSVSQFNGQGHL